MSEAVSIAFAPVEQVTRPSAATHWATRASFFIAGFGTAAWAPLIPLAKARMGLSDGQLGAMLLCLGGGSVIGMPVAGALAGRVGAKPLIAITALMATAALPALAIGSHVPLMAAALLLFGAGLGSMDVVMNIHAARVEHLCGRPVMSGFHGMYSAGGWVCAWMMSLLFWIGLHPLAAIGVVMVILLALLALSYTSFLPGGGDAGGPAFAVPHGYVLLLGAFCFVLFLSEGSVLDWSAVLLTNFRGMDAKYAGLGYGTFAAMMTICRLTGDWIVARIGRSRIVFLGSLCAATGFIIAATVPSPVLGVIGFGLVGLGASNVVPVTFSAAARQKVMPAGMAVAAITTVGYAGILLGPASIGYVAHLASLPVGLLVVAVALVMVAIFSTRAKLG